MELSSTELARAVPASRVTLITGAGGFIGARVVHSLLAMGFTDLRCAVRPSSDRRRLDDALRSFPAANVDIVEGDLLDRGFCAAAVRGTGTIYHLAAGIDKSFPGAFLNSVIATRNLLDAAVTEQPLPRFVNVSSIAVYCSGVLERGVVLDESTPLECSPVERGDAYAYGKIKQDELVLEYADRYGLHVTILRPGAVFGPGRVGITGRVGIDTFGVFLHLGGSNRIPFTFVDNCADAIALGGLVPHDPGEVFNVVDDDIPTSREFLRLYKKRVRRFTSLFVPYSIAHALCHLWEWYSGFSRGQLPPVFNRARARTEWAGTRYSNRKLKEVLGWRPRIPMSAALDLYLDYQRQAGASPAARDA